MLSLCPKNRLNPFLNIKVSLTFSKVAISMTPVWKVLRGSPTEYVKLKEAIIDNNQSVSDTASDKVVNQLKNCLQSVLSDALNKIVLSSSSNTNQIIKIFKEKIIITIPMAKLAAMRLLLDYSNKVFHQVNTLDCRCIIKPSSSAVSLIISENVQDYVGACELREKLFKST